MHFGPPLSYGHMPRSSLMCILRFQAPFSTSFAEGMSRTEASCPARPVIEEAKQICAGCLCTACCWPSHNASCACKRMRDFGGAATPWTDACNACEQLQILSEKSTCWCSAVWSPLELAVAIASSQVCHPLLAAQSCLPKCTLQGSSKTFCPAYDPPFEGADWLLCSY